MKKQFHYLNGMSVLTVKSHVSDSLQPCGCKLSVLLSFHINSTSVLRLGNLASRGASIDYMALSI